MNDRVFGIQRPTKIPFVILCYPRTGSYLLVDLLNQFPEISCYGEVFKEKFVELPEPEKNRVNYSLEQRNADPYGFVRALVSLDDTKHTGFKLFPGHCQEIVQWASHSTQIKRILLIRAPFDVYVSLKRATASGVWVDRWGNATKEAPKLRFETSEFDRMVQHILNHNSSMQSLAEADPGSTILIRYNQVTNIDEIRKVAAFIGATAQPEKLQFRLHRQTTEPYSQLFENFDELLDHTRRKYPKIWINPDRI